VAQVQVWRRSFDVAPMRRYGDVTPLPTTASLKAKRDRGLSSWTEAIALDLRAGRNRSVAAHGHSLRAIVIHRFGLTPDETMEIEIPTDNPPLIDLDADVKPITALSLDAARAQRRPPM
jgi:2,3-bisphosphoglycerate-dependent phosphoglycerate mutase